MLPIEALQERIEKSEIGQEYINNPLLNQDIWSLEKLGYTAEELRIRTSRNIYFEEFSRVDEGYYPLHLPLKSGREAFASSSFRKPWLLPLLM